MSKKNLVILVLIAVVLAVLSDVLWNVLVRQSKVTVTPTATITSTATATSTAVPTATPTRFPTFVPTLEPTQVPAPIGNGWKPHYEFGGGPTILVNSPCYAGELTDCVGKEVEIYLKGFQANEVYLNGFDGEHQDLWTIRLVPGHNQLTIPVAEDVGIGNMTNIDMAEFDSTGYYLSCVPNPSGEGCDCTQYNDWTTIYQSPIEGGFLTTIEFWSEYSNVFFLNDMVEKKSTPIKSGTVMVLPKYDHQSWDITVLPFYGERPTPMPSRTPTP